MYPSITASSFPKIHFYIHLLLGLHGGFRYSTETLYTFMSHVYYMPCPFHPSWADNYVWWVQVMKPLIMQASKTAYCRNMWKHWISVYFYWWGCGSLPVTFKSLRRNVCKVCVKIETLENQSYSARYEVYMAVAVNITKINIFSDMIPYYRRFGWNFCLDLHGILRSLIYLTTRQNILEDSSLHNFHKLFYFYSD